MRTQPAPAGELKPGDMMEYPRYQPLIFFAHIGDQYMEGVEEAVMKSAEYAAARGYRVEGIVQHDVLMWRVHGLGAMINNALMCGMEAEADYVMTVENDVLIPEDTIWRLATRSKPAIVPFFDQSTFTPPDNPYQRVTWPPADRDQGLIRIEWAASSLVMWSKEALALVGPRPYTNACILSEDEYNWRAWRLQGVYLWQDTSTVVKLLRPPSDMGEAGKLCPARGAVPQHPHTLPGVKVE